MKRFVVGATVAVKWFVPEVHAVSALRLSEAGDDLPAPDLPGAVLWVGDLP